MIDGSGGRCGRGSRSRFSHCLPENKRNSGVLIDAIRRRVSLGVMHSSICRMLRILSFFVVAALLAVPPASAIDDIVVAAVANRKPVGQAGDPDLADAVESAIAELRETGGLLGRPIRLLRFAEDCSSGTAEIVAGQIVARGADVVIGHQCSAAAIAAAPIYARHGIMMIASGPRTPRLTDARAGAQTFRLAGRDDRFGAETAELIVRRFPARRVAIVHDRSLQARNLADAADRELRNRGVVPVLRDVYTSGERSYKRAIERLAAAEAEVIVIPAQPVEAALIIEGLRARNSNATVIGSDILAVPEMEAVAQRLGESLIVLLPWPQLNASVTSSSGTSSSRGTRPTLERVAVEVWARAVQRAKSLDPAAIARVLETEPVETSLGQIRFDLKGDAVVPSYVAHTWRDGGWKSLSP